MLHAHLVFITKFRHPVFTGTHLTRLEETMRSVCADLETELAEFNGEATHVHLLVNFPPKIALSKLVNRLKGVSSHRTRQEFPQLSKWTPTCLAANRLYSPRYAVPRIRTITPPPTAATFTHQPSWQ
ncbi:hypothetical protein GCM10020216_024410 [Nonomuraea helvata]